MSTWELAVDLRASGYRCRELACRAHPFPTPRARDEHEAGLHGRVYVVPGPLPAPGRWGRLEYARRPREGLGRGSGLTGRPG